MVRSCELCLFRCKYLKKKDQYLKAAASGKIPQSTAMELIEIWKEEAESKGCDELQAFKKRIGED